MKEFIKKLRANSYIREKVLTDNISSFNFTRKAFYDNHWDNMTIKARGLFIDTNHNKIIARGFNKFFTLEEHKRLHIPYNLTFPLEVSSKANGYLGIFSTTYDGKPFFASKSTNEGWYAEEFERILRDKVANRLDLLTKYAYENNVTFLFEVLSINDKHIINFNENNIILLDVVKNNIDFKYYDYNTIETLAYRFGFDVRDKPVIIFNEQELKKYMAEMDRIVTEGFVARDANSFMFKYKAYYYRYWKNIRGVILALWSGKTPENIKRYMERCGNDAIVAKDLPIFVENWREHHDTCPHIMDYRSYAYDSYPAFINDLKELYD